MNGPVSLAQYQQRQFITACVYGAAGVGKTIFATGSKSFNTFVFDIDKGLLSAYRYLPPELKERVMVWPIDRRADFDNAINYLCQNVGKYQVAVIDTATELQRIILAELSGGKTAPRQETWGNVLLLFESVSRTLRSIQMHSIMLCHEGIQTTNGQATYAPSFQGQFLVQYAKHFDWISRMFLYETQVQDAATGTVKTEYARALNCQRDTYTEAKDRSQSLDKYEPADLDFIFGKMITALSSQPATMVAQSITQGQ